MSVFSCLNLSRIEIAVNVTILRESVEADAVLFFSCSQARKIKFLLSGVSSCERNLRLMSISICEVWSANALV